MSFLMLLFMLQDNIIAKLKEYDAYIGECRV